MSMLFKPLPDQKPRWRVFLASWGIEFLALLIFINLNIFFPPKKVIAKHYDVRNLVAYQPPIHHEPQPVNPRLAPQNVKLPELAAKPEIAKMELPPLAKAKRPKPEVKAPEFKPVVVKAPELPPRRSEPKVIATNTFSTGSSVMPTTNRPAAQVQTGGFGDPNGVAARPTNGHAVNINAKGSWDLPSAGGRGNGLGGANGVPGVVRSAGFGNGTAVGSPTRGGDEGSVKQAGFGDGKAVQVQVKLTAKQSQTTQVEILQKPKPDYTAEGHALKIEGEVQLQVLFTATGQVHVIGVVKGLGHGLDEQAVRAAESIKFKPAQHQGQPVDSTATLHIIFQLA